MHYNTQILLCLQNAVGSQAQGNQVTELEGRLRLTEAELAAVTHERDSLQDRLAARPLSETVSCKKVIH